ncbi:MAG: hypothetical protein Q4A54_03535 [Parabacteroides sp.]|nr:hypothetical protein [Parabacteroides sp.]
MDAMIKHRAEKEVLTLLRSLADMLDIKMTIYSESYQYQEGFREIWSVAGENSRLISILLNLFMQVWTRPSLSVGGAPAMFFTMEEEERLQEEIATLRLNLKKKLPGVTVSRDFVKLISGSPRICKNKSNFYEAVRGYPKVTKFTLRELNSANRSRSGSLEVKREQFAQYILRSDELPPIKDNKATIEIISPVLSDARFRWKGIYNKGGETIDFYMSDDEFKKEMFEEKIVFKSGMCIDCVLEIQRKINELGKVVHISYTVTTVIRTRFDKMEILTPQGKRHLRKLEAEKKQLTLDFFG